MSLATRCTTCGTIFRVVQDQLKVSEGWVRCGRCEEIFNALNSLFDLEREAPPPWPPSAAAPTAEWGSAPADSVPDVEASPPAAPLHATHDPAGLASQPMLHVEDPDLAVEDDIEAQAIEASGFEDARFHADLLEPDALTAVDAAAPATPEPEDEPRPEPAPAFIRQAERAARWRQPGVRAGMAALGLLLLVLLLAQIGLQFRSVLVAQWPITRALIEPLCWPARCSIEPPRRLDSLAVDSSTLVKLNDQGVYRLSVVLRNHGNVPAMLPAIDLMLTDSQGQLLARKALLPRDFGVRRDSLAGSAELNLQAVLATGESRVVGYTVEIFYP
jgi:predicted Zn finger-like uncharacterized protein